VGVCVRADSKMPKVMSAAPTAIQSAWVADPALGRAHGLLESDIQALTPAAVAAKATDEAQDQKRATSPLVTKTRNAAAKAVERAITRLAAVGALHYVTDPTVRAQFEALKGSGGGKGAKAKHAVG
jgi:hypothetical protein